MNTNKIMSVKQLERFVRRAKSNTITEPNGCHMWEFSWDDSKDVVVVEERITYPKPWHPPDEYLPNGKPKWVTVWRTKRECVKRYSKADARILWEDKVKNNGWKVGETTE